MALLYFTNNADSGDGTLRQAIIEASAGDTIMPSGFSPGDITILLSSYLPTKSVTIDAGANNRIVLDGQSSVDFFRVGGATINVTFRRVTFKNGYRSGSAPFYCSAVDSLVFDKCAIAGCSGAYSGFLYLTSNASGTVVFNDCLAYNNAVTTSSRGSVLFIASSSSVVVSVNNSTFGGTAGDSAEIIDNGQTTITGSIVANVNGIITDFSTAGMVDSASFDYRLKPDSSFLSGGSTTGTDYLGNTRTGALGAYSGSWFVLPYGEEATLSTSVIVDYISLASRTVILFDPNVFLTARISASSDGTVLDGGSSSFGYIAVPEGTDTSHLTLTNVKLCTSGAGITNASASAVSATVASVSWTQMAPDTVVLVEHYNGVSWDTVSSEAVSPTEVTLTSAYGQTFRLFDGERFVTVATDIPQYSFAIQYQVIGCIAPDLEEDKDWQTISTVIGVVDKMSDVKTGQAVTVLARVYDAFNNNLPLLNNGTNISSVYYTCERKTKTLYQSEYAAVQGHSNVQVDSTSVLSALETSDAWEIDNVGYNVVIAPNIRTNPLFDVEGVYRFKVTINLSSGNPIVFYQTVSVDA